jgi:hypothetical protein
MFPEKEVQVSLVGLDQACSNNPADGQGNLGELSKSNLKIS